MLEQVQVKDVGVLGNAGADAGSRMVQMQLREWCSYGCNVRSAMCEVHVKVQMHDAGASANGSAG
jgi:hypothetical protein